MVYYYRSWQRIPVLGPAAGTYSLRISVIIPARNEEETIGRLLGSLQVQTYPGALMEPIVVDDHSTDGTARVACGFSGVKVISLQEDGLLAYKKKALETGIAAASGEWIVTTDADCEVPPAWLAQIAACRSLTGARFIAAPVCMENDRSLLQIFQALDFLTLQGITAVAVHNRLHPMANGANLAYDRSLFYEVGGFSGIDDIASGDDMLLMQKIWKFRPDRIAYLKAPEAIVRTRPARTWREFLQQRIRWASKTTRYRHASLIAVLGLVYLLNLLFPVLLVAGLMQPVWLAVLLACWALKTAVEWPFVAAVARFFGCRPLMKYFAFLQPFHILYTLVAGFLGLVGRYEWKGRLTR
ncbi:MAG TPA: glycosyltransferase [Chitinophagaceae bacterium]|nr:glycosyltransferase [Chitinophagaceae bacterium]